MKPRMSVALATYDGARFLPQQLESLARQTEPACELVVGDDGSSDDTLPILRSFAETAPFPVHILAGPGAGGVAANFARIAAACTGDVIAFCDQDDIWHEDKIACLSSLFEQPEHAWLVVHDAQICREDGTATGRTLGSQLAGAGQGRDGLVAGCCMAFDVRFQPLFDPFPPLRHHDVFLADFAHRFGLAERIDEVLLRYRRHGSNASESWMSSGRPSSRRRALLYRMTRARAEPVLHRLRADREDVVAMIAKAEALRAVLLERVGPARYEEATLSFRQDLVRINARLRVAESPPIRRPTQAVRALAGGAYRRGSLASLVRDVFA